MKKLLGSLMLTGLLIAGTACGSDKGTTKSATTEAVTSGDGSKNADVTAYCKQADELAVKLKAVIADPSKGDVAAVTNEAQDLVAAAQKLVSAAPEDLDEINACSQRITAAVGG